MEAFKDTNFWLSVFLVLFCSCCSAKARRKAHRSENLTIEDAKFNHEGILQYQEAQTKVVYTMSGNDNHARCVFPFIYKGETFSDCTYKDSKHGKTWCATTSNYDKDEKWGHCQTDKDAPNCKDVHKSCGDWAANGECVTSSTFMCSECPRSCGLCTFGGNGRGKACSFPFFYKDKVVYECMDFNKKTWCATTLNYNKDKRWGYCFPKMYKNIQEVNRKYFNWGECDDRHRDCEKWASNGECEKDPKKMDRQCPWNCHKCAPEMQVSRKGCEDYSSMCESWAKRGDCTTMPVFMFAFCRWTCRRCAKSSIKITVRDRMPEQCPTWAKNEDCLTHQDFMLQNCRESCMAGGYQNGRMCLDNVANCPLWAKKGYCDLRGSKRRFYLQDNMRRHCRYSCGWC